MLNIAFLLDKFPQNGGVEKITIILSNELVKRDINVVIISKKGDKKELLEDLHKSVKYYGLNDGEFNSSFIGTLINRETIDILINQGAYRKTNNILWDLLRYNKIPVISVIHNDPNYALKAAKSSLYNGSFKSYIKKLFYPLYYIWNNKLEKSDNNKIIRNSTRVVLLSNSYVKDFLRIANSGKGISKIRVIANPVNYKIIQHLTKKKEIIYVGRLEETQKRVSRLLKIWDKIGDCSDWKLKIIGDGPDKRRYEDYVKSRNLKNIEFIGFQQNLEKYYNESSIIVLTSEFEGLPMTILEGMSYGVVPVIYNSFSAAADLINHGGNGYLIPPFKEDIFISNLMGLFENEKLLKKMSIKAIDSCSKFDKDMILSKWINLFNEIQDEKD